MFRMAEPDERKVEKATINDMNTGENVVISNPRSFKLQAVLFSTAYYLYQGKEYRFLLSKARQAGLDWEKN
jgi:hypothetical protein